MKTTYKTSIANLFRTLALVMLTALPVSAQGTAEVWLNKATENLQNKGIEITFRINEESIRISGKLLMDSQRFLYDTEDMKIWYDGTTQWTLQTGNGYNELYINSPTIEEQQSINPYLLLSNCKDNFTIADGGEKNLNGKLVHMVKLQAKKDSQDPANINIYILPDGFLHSLEFIASDEHSYKIEIRSMRSGLTFSKNIFTYSPNEYPFDEVIDLR